MASGINIYIFSTMNAQQKNGRKHTGAHRRFIFVRRCHSSSQVVLKLVRHSISIVSLFARTCA